MANLLYIIVGLVIAYIVMVHGSTEVGERLRRKTSPRRLLRVSPGEEIVLIDVDSRLKKLEENIIQRISEEYLKQQAEISEAISSLTKAVDGIEAKTNQMLAEISRLGAKQDECNNNRTTSILPALVFIKQGENGNHGTDDDAHNNPNLEDNERQDESNSGLNEIDDNDDDTKLEEQSKTTISSALHPDVEETPNPHENAESSNDIEDENNLHSEEQEISQVQEPDIHNIENFKQTTLPPNTQTPPKIDDRLRLEQEKWELKAEKARKAEAELARKSEASRAQLAEMERASLAQIERARQTENEDSQTPRKEQDRLAELVRLHSRLVAEEQRKQNEKESRNNTKLEEPSIANRGPCHGVLTITGEEIKEFEWHSDKPELCIWILQIQHPSKGFQVDIIESTLPAGCARNHLNFYQFNARQFIRKNMCTVGQRLAYDHTLSAAIIFHSDAQDGKMQKFKIRYSVSDFYKYRQKSRWPDYKHRESIVRLLPPNGTVVDVAYPSKKEPDGQMLMNLWVTMLLTRLDGGMSRLGQPRIQWTYTKFDFGMFSALRPYRVSAVNTTSGGVDIKIDTDDFYTLGRYIPSPIVASDAIILEFWTEEGGATTGTGFAGRLTHLSPPAPDGTGGSI